MSLKYILSALVFAAVVHGAGTVRADELIEEYNAYIAFEDTYNSKGEVLTEPWQVIRQDRANYHRYGISQKGDETDAFFASADNRALAEDMLRDVSFSPREVDQIVGGDAHIHVSIYRSDSGDDYLEVDVR